MRTPRPIVVATAMATTAVLLGSPGSLAGAEPPKPVVSKADSTQPSRWITLITGDRVQVTPQPGKPDAVHFHPAKNSRSRGAVISRTGDGHTLVVPTSVAADVAAGRLETALFDVTTLLAERYDDARSKVMPVILSYTGPATTARTRAAQDKPAGAARTRVLNSIGARSVAVTKTSATAFWSSVTAPGKHQVEATVAKIRLDRRVKASVDLSVPQIGAPAAWQRGFTGKGVKVAILDTGIDTGHPDLAGKVIAQANFSESAGTTDQQGHGTHVAATVAGSGAASGGKYRGVAPDASLLNGRVLDESGYGTFSGIIAGMEWAAIGQGADVINMSLGGGPSDGTDVMSQAVNTLSRQTGALFVIAAGNCFLPEPQSVSSPASADLALAVANLERDGSLAHSSCHGPRRRDFGLKPEIAAPGSGIVSARAAGTELGQPVGEHYTTLTGTSMATPHVAGTAALLAQQHPDWTGEQLKTRLITTSDPQPGSTVSQQGTGRVDADQATATNVSVDTGVLDFGFLQWPHDDQGPITKRLTYRNAGTTPVTLALKAEPAGPTFSAGTLTVPAGGQAAVDVTVDPGTSTGHKAGRVLATPEGGGDPVVSPYTWFLEDERYELAITGIDRAGSAANGPVVFSRPDGGGRTDLDPETTRIVNGKLTVRVPPGVYDVTSLLKMEATDTATDNFSLVAAPEVKVTGNTAITLDARTAVRTAAAPADVPGLNAREVTVTYVRTDPNGRAVGWLGAVFNGPPLDFFATPTKPVSVGGLEYAVGGRLEVPPYVATVGGKPLEVAAVSWAPRFTGLKNLVAVDAGDGSAGELTDVRGKLAVIRHDPEDGWADPIILAAQAAGAAAVLLYNPNAPGLIGGQGSIGGDGVTVPVLQTSRVTGARLVGLIAQQPVTVRILGVAETPFVYDLMHPWNDAVPADPRYRPRTADLARVDETFGSHEPGMRIQEFREGRTPNNWVVNGFHDLAVMMYGPSKRTSFLSTDHVSWTQGVLPSLSETGYTSWYAGNPATYQQGQRLTEKWFTPVATSSLPDTDRTFLSVNRVHGGVRACFSPLDNPGQHAEWSPAGDFQMTFRRNGSELPSIDSHCAQASIPDGPADLEIDLDVRRKQHFWKYSTHVRSTWAFRSAGGADEVMPVVLADLDVPSANSLNQVKVGKPTGITLGLRHQKGSKSSAFTSAKLELSYDGSTWTSLPLTSAGANRYTTTVTHPATQAGKAPSLRLQVTDAAGGKLTQEVTAAYGLID
ncbi:S8 family peptidase [Kribbella deserti]|uniref:S8 family serine peptidase n=1 Tax=Kribbella deserti TaxID=1926257 RepID=A0ABV6QV52_9ACTN